MIVRMTHSVNVGAINALFAPGSRVYQDMLRRGIKVQNGVRRCVRVDTGRLRSSYQVSGPIVRNGAAGVRVGTNVEYAIYLEEGTRYIQGDHCLRNSLQEASS